MILITRYPTRLHAIITIRTTALKFAFEASLGLVRCQYSTPGVLQLEPPTTLQSNDPNQLGLLKQPSIESAVTSDRAALVQVGSVRAVGTRIGYVLPIAGTVAKATLSLPHSLTVSKVVPFAFESPR